MSNLTSTQPGAFDALLGLLQAAASGSSNPVVYVEDSEVVNFEPAAYVLLHSIEQHEFDIAALGSYAFEETYELVGTTTYLQGDTDTKTVRDTTFSIHENIVQATVVANRGQPPGTKVLGAAAPSNLIAIWPTYQRYSGGPGNFGGGQAGYQGVIDWRFSVKARITVA